MRCMPTAGGDLPQPTIDHTALALPHTNAAIKALIKMLRVEGKVLAKMTFILCTKNHGKTGDVCPGKPFAWSKVGLRV